MKIITILLAISFSSILSSAQSDKIITEPEIKFSGDVFQKSGVQLVSTQDEISFYFTINNANIVGVKVTDNNGFEYKSSYTIKSKGKKKPVYVEVCYSKSGPNHTWINVCKLMRQI